MLASHGCVIYALYNAVTTSLQPFAPVVSSLPAPCLHQQGLDKAMQGGLHMAKAQEAPAEEGKAIRDETEIGTEMTTERGMATVDISVRTAELVIRQEQGQRQQPQQRQQQDSKALASPHVQRMQEMLWMKVSRLREDCEKMMMNMSPGQPRPADRQQKTYRQRLESHQANHHQAKPMHLLQALLRTNAKLIIMFLLILMTYGML